MTLFEYISRFLCPPCCSCCKTLLPFYDDSAFCDKCYEELMIRLKDASCDIDNPHLDNLYYMYDYKSWYVKQIVFFTKNVSSKEYLKFIEKLGLDSLRKHNLLNVIDVITFTPRRKAQKQKFDFDQAEELACAISRSSGTPSCQLLFRQGYARQQKKLNKKERAENVVGKFICNENLAGKTILLVDDVVTTGATMSECAKLLKANGAKSVIGWCLAK